MQIPKIVITGGPCAGKTSAMKHMSQILRDSGFTPIVVPETATLVINSGFKPGENIDNTEFQRAILQIIIATENAQTVLAQKMAEEGQKPIILLDRGTMDAVAYMENTKMFRDLTREEGYTIGELRDDRYDGVIHLRTTALGAEEVFSQQMNNNSARREAQLPLEQAIALSRELDQKTLSAWVGSPHLAVVSNTDGQSWDDKLLAIEKQLKRIVGIPTTVETERKWILEKIPETLPVYCAVSQIQQVYLHSDDPLVTRRVRARTSDEHTVYTVTEKTFIEDGSNYEKERKISEVEYNELLRNKDSECWVISKKRTCFEYDGQYFELDQFTAPNEIQMLELEVNDINDSVELPDFLGELTEVTGDIRFSNKNIAQKKA